jgi:hypothetical protein
VRTHPDPTHGVPGETEPLPAKEDPEPTLVNDYDKDDD